MIGDPTVLPPAVVLALFAPFVAAVPARVRRLTGTVLLVGIGVFILVVPSGRRPSVTMLGVEVIPVVIDPVTRILTVCVVTLGIILLTVNARGPPSRGRVIAELGLVAGALLLTGAGDWITIVIGTIVFSVFGTIFVQNSPEGLPIGWDRTLVVQATAIGLLIVGAGIHAADRATGESPIPVTPALEAPLAIVSVLLGIGLLIGLPGLDGWFTRSSMRSESRSPTLERLLISIAGLGVVLRTVPDDVAILAWIGGFTAMYGATLSLLVVDQRRWLGYVMQAHLGIALAGIGVGVGSLPVILHIVTITIGGGLLTIAITVQAKEGHRDRAGDSVHGDSGGTWIGAFAFVTGGATVIGVPVSIGFSSLALLLGGDAAAALGGHWIPIALAALLLVASMLHRGDQLVRRHTVGDREVGDLQLLLVIAALSVVSIIGGLQPNVLVWAGFDTLAHHPLRLSGTRLGVIVAWLVGGGLLHLTVGGRLPVVAMDRDMGTAIESIVARGTHVLVTAVSRAGAWTGSVVRVLERGSVRLIRQPAMEISRHLPEKYRSSYTEKSSSTPGKTGTKVSLDASLYIIVLGLAALLFLGLR